MNALADYVGMLTSSDWVYVIIFLVAVAEASVLTSYLLSGTIGFVVVGILISQHALQPGWSILAVYSGTLVGDISSFALSRALQRIPFIASALDRVGHLREPLARTPVRFILVGHLTPYLRALLPVLAAGIVPTRTYLRIEVFGALLGTCFLIGVGYFGANAVSAVGLQQSLILVGVIAAVLVAGMWIYSRRPFCRRNAKWRSRWTNALRGARFFLWYPLWHPCRWIELCLRRSPSRQLRRALQDSFPDVRAGDIFVIRLHAPAPWGRWAHSAIAIDGRRFCHGFSSIVTAHAIGSLPVRYAIAHLRVRCEDTAAQVAADVARDNIGAPVSITVRRGNTGRFSCASLIAHAYDRAGIELVDAGVSRVVPDDLFASPQVELVRIVNTEKVRRETRRYVFEARKDA